MKITREEAAPREVVLNIEFDSDDIEPYLDRSYKRVVNRVQVPGFRPGKAPRFILENYVGRVALVRESLDFILQESLDKALKEEDLESFGEPDVEVVEIDPLSYKAVVPLEPIVDLNDFRSIRLEPEQAEVSQEEVDKVLEHMRYSSAPWEPADRPVQFGDLVTLDVDGSVEGKKVANEKGVEFIPDKDNPSPFPGFSVYLEGLKKEASKEFTLPIAEDHRDPALAGKECRFNVKVLEIKEKLLPALDDEFAKGAGDGHETLEDLRASILTDLTEQTEKTARRAFQEKALEQVVAGASLEISDFTTNKEIAHLLEEQLQDFQGRRMDLDTYLQGAGKSREEVRESLKPAAKERLTRAFVVRKLAEVEGIEVAGGEIDAEIDDLASSSGESGESLRKAFSSENARNSIASALLQKRVLERLEQIVQGIAEDSTALDEEKSSEPAEDQGEDEESSQPKEDQGVDEAAEGEPSKEETPT